MIAAIAAVSLLSSCVRTLSEDATAVYSKWESESPRNIAIAAEIEPVTASFKRMVGTRYAREPYRSSGGDSSLFKPGCGPGQLLCPVAFIIILPVALVLVGAVGSASGAQGKRLEVHEDIDISQYKGLANTISSALKDIGFTHALVTRIARIGRNNTIHNVEVSDAEPAAELGYPSSSSDEFVKFTVKRLQLVSKEKSGDSMRLQIGVSSETKIQIDGVNCSFDGAPIYYESRARNLDDWAANNAVLFRQEMISALDELAKRASKELYKSPKKQDVTCDFFNSPAALNLQENWKREIRDKLLPGKTTKAEVLKLLGNDSLHVIKSKLGRKMIYHFSENSINPVSKEEMEWRYLTIVLNEDNIVEYVWTYLDAETAIHRAHKIQVGKTTKEQALRILAEPPDALNTELRTRVLYESPGAWVLELLFDSNNLVKHIYKRWDEFSDIEAACEGARHGSHYALKDLGDHFYPGFLQTTDTTLTAYKWYLILKRNGGKDYARQLNVQSYPSQAVAEAARLAALWPKGACP